jgi:hypothetical protein
MRSSWRCDVVGREEVEGVTAMVLFEETQRRGKLRVRVSVGVSARRQFSRDGATPKFLDSDHGTRIVTVAAIARHYASVRH